MGSQLDRLVDGNEAMGNDVVLVARGFFYDGNHYDFESHVVVLDYTFENQVYYLVFDLSTDFDFDFALDSHGLL